MEKMKESMARIIVCLGEAAVGIVLLIDPESFSKFVLIAAGILFAVLGALSVISYFRMDPAEAALSQELARGLVELAFGVLVIWKADWITGNIKYLAVIYGGAAIFVGFLKLQWTVDMARLKTGLWQSAAVSALLSIVLGIIVLAYAKKALWVFAGISLIVTAASTLLTIFLPGKKPTDVE